MSPDETPATSDSRPESASPVARRIEARPRAADSRNAAVAAWLARQQKPVYERDLGIGKALGSIRRDVSSRRNRLGELVEPWERLVPEAIKARSRVEGLRGDTLMVTVDSAATSWQLDRLLRAGLCQSLARASSDRVRRVRLKVGSIDEPSAGDRRR